MSAVEPMTETVPTGTETQAATAADTGSSDAVTDAIVPPLAAPRRTRQPTVAERTTGNGLRVMVVRRPGVPLVELRLRVPFGSRAATHLAKGALLSETMLSGTSARTNVDIAADLQDVGGSLSVSTDPDRLMVSGTGLAAGLPRLLDVLADVLVDASFPADEVLGERARLAERLRMARSQPSVIAAEALHERYYGTHPYARTMPQVTELQAVTRAQLRALHRGRVVPDGSTLVLVGDVSPARTLDVVERALSTWDSEATARPVPVLTAVGARPLLLVDRPGAVQSNIRIAGPAARRQEDNYPAAQLANMVFGGYFSARLTENIREDKGYTYSPHCIIDHSAAGSALMLGADVATEVTAPALLEIGYELGRMVTGRVTQDELDNARQFAIGSMALQTATQAGLASMLTALVASGLGVEWLREHPRRLTTVTIEDVYDQAVPLLSPIGLTTVVVGDAAVVRGSLAALGEVEQR